MEFRPRAPREGINVSETNPLREAALLVVGLTVVLILAVFLLGVAIDYGVGFVPAATEQRVFGSLAGTLATIDVAPDDRRITHLQGLVDRLGSHWVHNPYSFQVAVLDDEDGFPNAAAFPGGLILVTEGLLDSVENENELAFVIAHEIGHFRYRHHLRSLGRGLTVGILFTALGLGDSAPALTNVAGDLTSLRFDREQEREADRFGLELVALEYGHVGASWRFFERFTGEEILDLMVAYISTHPAPGNRIEDLKTTATERGWALEGPLSDFPELPLEAQSPSAADK